MSFEVIALPMLQDNYSWALIDHAQGKMAIVDPAEAAPVSQLIAQLGVTLAVVLLTHHHADHIGGAEDLRRQYHCEIWGAAADQYRLPSLDRALHDGDAIAFAGVTGKVLAVPGHTVGHLAFYFAAAQALFCGDTLFSLGCGRLFEGTPEQMFASLARLAALPPATRVFCGHEYTASNGRFALTVEPGNADLAARMAEVTHLRAAGLPTVPSTMGRELAANPFLRTASPKELAEIRKMKDNFRG